MMDALTFLGPAFAMCVVIATLHVWLGMHVLAREVIFVDLSLAQLAAFGATAATIAIADEGDPWTARAGALLFTFAGAALFAFTRRIRKHVSEEAIVGITYAVSSALTVLVVSQSPHGAEHIKDILVGSLLVVEWDQVGATAAAYVVLGALHVVWRQRLVRMSWHPDVSEREMKHVELWDFVFYLLFGIAITMSVQVAGVLLVFSYLIVPAVITRLYSERLLVRLIAGWGIAVVGSVTGLAASWAWDLPTGAAVVAALGLLVPIGAAGRLLPRKRP